MEAAEAPAADLLAEVWAEPPPPVRDTATATPAMTMTAAAAAANRGPSRAKVRLRCRRPARGTGRARGSPTAGPKARSAASTAASRWEAGGGSVGIDTIWLASRQAATSAPHSAQVAAWAASSGRASPSMRADSRSSSRWGPGLTARSGWVGGCGPGSIGRGDTGTDGPRRQLEHLGDLGVVQSAHVAQHHRGPEVGGEAPEGRIHVEARCRRLGVAADAYDREATRAETPEFSRSSRRRVSERVRRRSSSIEQLTAMR